MARDIWSSHTVWAYPDLVFYSLISLFTRRQMDPTWTSTWLSSKRKEVPLSLKCKNRSERVLHGPQTAALKIGDNVGAIMTRRLWETSSAINRCLDVTIKRLKMEHKLRTISRHQVPCLLNQEYQQIQQLKAQKHRAKLQSRSLNFLRKSIALIFFSLYHIHH